MVNLQRDGNIRTHAADKLPGGCIIARLGTDSSMCSFALHSQGNTQMGVNSKGNAGNGLRKCHGSIFVANQINCCC